MGAARHPALVYALDVPTLAVAREQIARLRDAVDVFKVGLELYTAVGPAAVEAVHEAGRACFLDLKLHDIPNTMRRAVRAATSLGVGYLTVHASSGPTALRSVAEEAAGGPTRLLGVTLVTSLNATEVEAIGLRGDIEQVVRRLSLLCRDAGIQGFVSSVSECRAVRRLAGAQAVIATPGIRPGTAPAGDQSRVATVRAALEAGADLLVVGRPIREAPDPSAEAERIAREIRAARAEA